jgi:hypothetical protein
MLGAYLTWKTAIWESRRDRWSGGRVAEQRHGLDGTQRGSVTPARHIRSQKAKVSF